MKKIAYLLTLAAGILLSNSLQAQPLTVSSAKVISAQNSSIVFVAGTLTPVKGSIPGITVDITDNTGKTVRLVTNAPANGNTYSYATVIPADAKLTAPYKITVITNRQVSVTQAATACSCN